MGQPKSKRTAMLDPRHRAKLLKEKYRQQLAERREPESDSAETQAVDEVEDTANWTRCRIVRRRCRGQGKNRR